jgi:hypothetical protein
LLYLGHERSHCSSAARPAFIARCRWHEILSNDEEWAEPGCRDNNEVQLALAYCSESAPAISSISPAPLEPFSAARFIRQKSALPELISQMTDGGAHAEYYFIKWLGSHQTEPLYLDFA